MTRCLSSGLAMSALLGLAGAVGAADYVAETDDPLAPVFEVMAEAGLGLVEGDVFTLTIDAAPRQAFSVSLPVAGQPYTLDLTPHSVRSPDYQLLVQLENGMIVPAERGPVRTLRGSVRGVPGSHVAASLGDNGLHAMIDLGDGAGRFFIEPIARVAPGADDHHVIYDTRDVLPSGGACGLAEGLEAEQFNDAGDSVSNERDYETAAGTGVCIAELACDADTEYFQAYGSVAAVEARINAVINVVNLQYEQQVAITHQITNIIVRTGSDPYTSTDAATRLCQFITEWTNNQTGIQRDLAHLFTGVDLFGSTIGIAADIGGSGICVTNGACTGGPFGPLGSYTLAQSDFDPNLACATDLSAHEMGHLWGAFHCSCPNNTMNSSITCTNSFSAGSINSINNYRNSRSCLSGSCNSGAIPPANDSCSTATSIPCNTTVHVNTSSATPATGAGPDSDLPSGSPSCQFQGVPSAVHNTVWYAFVATHSSVEIRTCDTVGIADTIIALYDGSCGSLVELACGEDTCGASTYMSRICAGGLTPGNTYLVMVGHPGGWAESTPGLVTLDVNCPCPDIQDPTGACCVGQTCTIETAADCGGAYQGDGTDCSGNPCGGGGDVDNVATSDFSTGFGSIASGSFTDTHTQNDVSEAITEEQTNGNPARRRSRLEHTWQFNVASGSSFTFFVDAYHTPNSEGDDFDFSYSLDNSAYTPMLTVTKTADDDALQVYLFPGNVAGTVYIRVEDTDRAQGNSSLDTVFVDEMFIRSSSGGGDVTPPAAPTGLGATAGNGQVALDWNDNGEPDLAGYDVYRSTSSGGPYSQVNGALVGSSSYVDTSVSNGTTYYYVVTAVDTSSNESGDSNEASATPMGGGPAVHVDSITVFTNNIGQGNKRGVADVIIVDQNGTPVANADVTGTFFGDIPEGPYVMTTNGSGLAHFETVGTEKGGVNVSFCVDNVVHPTLPYDEAANVEDCDTN